MSLLLYRYNSPYDTGIWVQSKALAEKWLEEYKDNIEFELFDLGDRITIESLELYDLDSKTDPEDIVKVVKAYELVKNDDPDLENPRELGYDFDFFAMWKEVEMTDDSESNMG